MSVMGFIQEELDCVAEVMISRGYQNKHEIEWHEHLEYLFAVWIVNKFTEQEDIYPPHLPKEDVLPG
jgi:hypothetical protein